jgi:hypothetical protein
MIISIWVLKPFPSGWRINFYFVKLYSATGLVVRTLLKTKVVIIFFSPFELQAKKEKKNEK